MVEVSQLTHVVSQFDVKFTVGLITMTLLGSVDRAFDVHIIVTC